MQTQKQENSAPIDECFIRLRTEIYERCAFEISDRIPEPESKAYGACQFKLNGRPVLYRNAKQTPKKVGLFVTCWTRNASGVTEPWHENSPMDFYVINANTEKGFGQFVFPKSVLIEKGIMSTSSKAGKRGFRVYTPWDSTKSKQAQKTQQWQCAYFYEINATTDLQKVIALYEGK